MADAPASGGSKWEPFEILLIVVLIGGVLMKLDGGTRSPATPTTGTVKNTSSISTATPREACGLTTSRPRSLEKVSTFVTISGTVSGCNWIPTESIALYAQVVDSGGKPVSEYTAIPAGNIQNLLLSFSASVPLINAPKKGTGYLILIPATVPQNGQTTTARIPLTFSAY